MRVKIFLVLDIDEEEYPVPADGMVDEEIEQSLEQHIYDIDGIKIQSIKTITE
tara:strand:- start:510 stop:668 length:159 start_codon:yes stop_codon:yes gene_type:complete